MSIRARIALLVLAVSSVLTGAGLWFFDRHLVGSLRQTIDETLDARAAPLAAELVADGAHVERQQIEASVASTPRAVTHVLDADGQVVASSLGDDAEAERLLPTTRLGPLDRRRYFEVDIDTEHLEETRVLALPVDRADGTWVVIVGSSLEIMEHAEGVRDGLMLGGALAVVITTIGAWLLADAALRPVERMRRMVAAAITAGEDDLLLSVPGRRNELTRLAVTFNDLLARMRSALARQRRLVADASHELRSPLAAVRAELELAARPGRSVEELRTAIDSAHADATRLGLLADALLLLARSEDGGSIVRRERQDVAALLDQSVAAFEQRADRAGVELTSAYERPLWADCDPLRLRQAVDNLVDNALRHTPAGGTVVVAASVSDQLRISVADTGPGFPPDFLPQAFVPFQRADSARRRHDGGAGLGLAIVHSIAEAHGGKATATNRPSGAGAVVALTLPP